VSDIALKQPLPQEVGDSLMAYVGCIAGAIPIETYKAGLAAAGFSAVQVIDSGADLNAYASVEGQSGCCSPSMKEDDCCEQPADGSECCDKPAVATLPLVSCCSTGTTSELHAQLGDLLARYNVNDYAASVKVYAVKP
jgi:hypothetical protein